MVSYRELMDFEKAGTLSPQVFHSEEIYQRELRTVFAKSWLFLAHESQLKRPGDFVTALMGEDPVIVSRQKDGSLRAFLNVCRHRGMRVCRQDLGNSTRFTCSYHGWSYNEQGTLSDVPEEESGYHNSLDKTGWSLVPVARIDTYRGLIFATWDENAPSLPDYLHNGVPLIDAWLDRHSSVEFVGPMKWRLAGNWKLAAEQFASDTYHAPTAHASASTALNMPLSLSSADGIQMTSPDGHGGSFMNVATYEEKTDVEALTHLNAQRRHARRLNLVGATIFPNLSFLGIGTLRVWHPRGADGMEIWSWVAVPADADAETKRQVVNTATMSFSTAGIFETDDSENWSEIQAVSRGAMAREVTLNYQMGFGHDTTDEDALPGVDATVGHFLNDIGSRGFYTRWAELMDQPPVSITVSAPAPL